MKRITYVVLALALLPLFAQAQEQTPPPPAEQTSTTSATTPAIPRDEKVDTLAADLYALSRIVNVAEDVNRSRQLLLAITDSNINTLRMPREDGTFRWASLQREDGGAVKDEKTIEQVHTEKELRNVTVTASNAFRVVITVPQKRGLITGNNRVWVRNVLVDSTGFDGKTTHHEIPVNAWVNPGDANGVALPDIGKSVKATAELGVESGSRKATAEVALIQAKLIDDPASPYHPAVRRLLQIREFSAAENINRGYLKNAIDEALLALPGELEKRAASQLAASEERKRFLLTGQPKGAIALGDATPDVVNALSEINKLLTGTLEQQTEGRAKLTALIETLAPKPLEASLSPQP